MRTRVWVWGLVMGVVCGAGCGDDERMQHDGGDKDGDGWHAPLDCDDADASVFPGADEVPYDGIDQDCSGSDWVDVDADGFEGGEREAGAAGAAGSSGGGAEDCDDTRPDVNPAAVDVCGDGIDQDCSGSDQACDELDRDGDGWTGQEGDCNDLDAAVHPEADEVYYNGVDDDCDPETEDGDQDGDGFSRFSGGDCDDEDASVFPGAEEIPYDGIDQDCSGEDLVDVDGDGVAGGPEGEDCDDQDSTIRPGRDEIVVDGVDQNCDGSDLAGVDAFTPFSSSAAVPADVAALASGRDEDGGPVALAAWADSRTAPRQDVVGQVLRENGSASGNEIEIASGGLEKFNVRVTSDGEGFLVTWETSEGVFGRLMTAEGPAAGETQIAPVGASGSQTAFGGGNYAIVWRQTDATPSELRVRMLSQEGVKAENLAIVADANAEGVAIAGRSSELVAVWASNGIQGQVLDGLGERVGERFTLAKTANLGMPAIAAAEAGYYVAFRRQTAPYSVHGLMIDGAGEALSSVARLSDDSIFVDRVTALTTPNGFFVAWSDARHTIAAPGYAAIYGNEVGFAGVPMSVSDRALHVEFSVTLGGLALVGERVLMSSRNLQGIGALVVQ